MNKEPLTQETKEMRETFTGRYGIVLIPDAATCEQAKKLASELIPNAEYSISKLDQEIVPAPHVTLYHAPIANLSSQAIRDIMRELAWIVGRSFTLNELQVYGDKFLFWNVKKDTDIQKAHETALNLVNHFDSRARQNVDDEALNIPERERENVKFYGHPLVGELYTPHITLGYDSKGIRLAQQASEKLVMRIDDCRFVETGKWGSVKQLVEF